MHLMQDALLLGSIPFVVGITQNFFDNNMVGVDRFFCMYQYTFQVVGAMPTLYLMLATRPFVLTRNKEVRVHVLDKYNDLPLETSCTGINTRIFKCNIWIISML